MHENKIYFRREKGIKIRKKNLYIYFAFILLSHEIKTYIWDKNIIFSELKNIFYQ